MKLVLCLLACSVPRDAEDACLHWSDGAACYEFARTIADPQKRERVLGMACTWDSLPACAEKRSILRRSGLTARDPSDAKRKMTAACDADLPAGCRELGFLLSGQAARDAFGKACKLGDSEACAVLADAPPLSP